MFPRGKSVSVLIVTVLTLHGAALAQTCLDHDFSDDTEFYIQSDAPAYRNFAYGGQGASETYWTSDVRQLIGYMRADDSEWTETDEDWPASAITIKLTDGNYLCDAAIADDTLYAMGEDSRLYLRELSRAERNQIMNRLNEISRMSIQ